MVLVVHPHMRFDNTNGNAYWRYFDAEALPEAYQRSTGILNSPFHEEYGYLEICP